MLGLLATSVTVALLHTSVSASSLRRLGAMEYQALMSSSQPTCVIENGFDYVGNDITNVLGAAESCCDKCSTVLNCAAWSWSNLNGGTCWLKETQGQIVVSANVKSGVFFRGEVGYCQLEQDTDYVGNDIANKPSASADGCCSICQTTLGCRAYSWSNFNGGTCWLKSSAGQKITKAGVKAAMAYPAFGSTCPTLTTGVDYVDGDIANSPSATAAGCCEICKGFPHCRAFSWTNQNGGTCWLKSGVTTTVANAAVTSARVIPSATASCSTVENDVDYVGNDVANAAAGDSSQCCSLCGANSACKAWTWSNYNGGTCWLKSAKGQTASTAGVKSAVLA